MTQRRNRRLIALDTGGNTDTQGAAVVETAEEKALKEDIRELHKAKKEKSALDAKVRKLEGRVKKGLKPLPGKQLTTYMMESGKRVNLLAELTTPKRKVVDVDALLGEVKLDSFMQMASVSQTAVKENHSTSLLNKVLVEVDGNESLSVKPVAE